MALTQTHKWIAVGGLALGAMYLGYITLFPQTGSKYAQTSSQVTHVEPVESSVPSVNEGKPVAQAQLFEQALSEKLASQLAPPTERTKPLALDTQALEYLTKSRSVTLAELDAQLREQNARAQPNAAMTGLGLDTPMQPSNVQTQSAPAPSEVPLPVTLGSVFQLADRSYAARLHYQGRWHKVTKGSRISDLSVVGISDSGVRVRVNGQVYRLLPGGGYE